MNVLLKILMYYIVTNPPEAKKPTLGPRDPTTKENHRHHPAHPKAPQTDASKIEKVRRRGR